MLERDRPKFNGLYWSDIFKSEEEFKDKVVSVGGVTQLDDLYEVLIEKYAFAETNYTNEMAFILAIRRQLRVEYSSYVHQKALIEQIQALELEEIQKGARILINQVEHVTDDGDLEHMADKPLQDVSTVQTSQLSTLSKLEALKQKYYAVRLDYLSQIYRKMDPLFNQLLADDIVYVYEE